MLLPCALALVAPPLLTAKRELLLSLANTDRGFNRTAQATVRRAIAALPATSDGALEGNWTLAWTDAPDILGLPGPVRIGQEIDKTTIVNVIDYEAFHVRLQQRVILDYVKDQDDVRLTLRGLGGKLEKGPNVQANALFGLPFGRFTVLFNDGDLRVVRTNQGHLSVNLRSLGY